MSRFVTTARHASTIGREHVRLGKNNQDGVCTLVRDGTAVAVVADGCSSQPSSEVGARLGARRLANVLLESNAVSLDALAEFAVTDLSAWLGVFFGALGPGALEDFGLFTVLAAVQRGNDALVFSVGDGAAFIDGRVVQLDAGEENAPAYVAYRLIGGNAPIVTLHRGPATRIALMTDGFGGWLSATPSELPSLLEEPLVWTNPVHLQRRLNVLRETHRFTDDATLAVLDTRECQ